MCVCRASRAARLATVMKPLEPPLPEAEFSQEHPKCARIKKWTDASFAREHNFNRTRTQHADHCAFSER